MVNPRREAKPTHPTTNTSTSLPAISVEQAQHSMGSHQLPKNTTEIGSCSSTQRSINYKEIESTEFMR